MSGREAGALFKIGGAIPTVPPGYKWAFIDSDGVLKTLDSAGTTAPVGAGQDPAAVAITGGAIAGTSTNGYTPAQMIAAQSYSDNFERFKRSAYASMIAGDPTLTAFKAMPLGLVPGTSAFGAFANDANIEGGGITPPDNAQLGFGATVFQRMDLGHWAFFWEGKATSGATAHLGAQKVDTSFGIWIGTLTGSSNFTARIFNAGGTTTRALSAADGNIHIFGLVDTGTVIKPYIDGVEQTNESDRSRLASGAAQLYFYNVVAGQAKVQNVAWGYIPV